MPFYYDTGEGLTEAPIVLEQTQISGAVFVGNIALAITASTLYDGSSGSISAVDVGSNYWDGSQWVRVSGSNGAVAVTGNIAISSSADTPVYVTGNFATAVAPLSTATTYMYAVSTSSILLVPTNLDRKQLNVYNDCDFEMYVAFSATASTSSFTLKIPPFGYFEVVTNNGVYVGPLSGIWAVDSSGRAAVTEVVV